MCWVRVGGLIILNGGSPGSRVLAPRDSGEKFWFPALAGKKNWYPAIAGKKIGIPRYIYGKENTFRVRVGKYKAAVDEHLCRRRKKLDFRNAEIFFTMKNENLLQNVFVLQTRQVHLLVPGFERKEEKCLIYGMVL